MTPAGRHVKVGAFPISIDVAEFTDVAAERNVRRASATVRSRLGNPEVVLLGVDRLDYTKGIGRGCGRSARCSTTARSMPSAA